MFCAEVSFWKMWILNHRTSDCALQGTIEISPRPVLTVAGNKAQALGRRKSVTPILGNWFQSSGWDLSTCDLTESTGENRWSASSASFYVERKETQWCLVCSGLLNYQMTKPCLNLKAFGSASLLFCWGRAGALNYTKTWEIICKTDIFSNFQTFPVRSPKSVNE